MGHILIVILFAICFVNELLFSLQIKQPSQRIVLLTGISSLDKVSCLFNWKTDVVMWAKSKWENPPPVAPNPTRKVQIRSEDKKRYEETFTKLEECVVEAAGIRETFVLVQATQQCK